MSGFLLELLSEEIPARMQAKASADLARLFSEQLTAAGLKAEAIETYATPRRLALIARGLPAETEAVSEEIKGPRASAPPQALEGFLRKTGLTREQLVERDGVLFAIIDKPGRKTADVLAEAIPQIIRAFPWPKSMRWGAASQSTESLRWVRPLQGIVAILGEDVVEFEVAGVRSGAATVGHRFHHPGIITIGSAHDYAEKLRACHVIIDPAERRRIIAEGAARAAAAAGLALVEDEGLIHENAGLTEWPVPLLGAFDPAFLDVPREVIQLTMRTNQKYFALTDGEGRLAPNFVCVANIEASDGGRAIVAGNEKVLAARLSDAKFFWEQDLKVPLEEQAKKLDQIVFHEKLGTVADKVERVAKLARWLVEEGIVGAQDSVRPERSRGAPAQTPHERPSTTLGTNEVGDLAQMAETAARLAKADLVTGMVGEFPELQGLIGGYLARAQGHGDAIADAIRDHYKPVGQGDEVPTAPVTVAVSLADKLDSLGAFFAIDQQPTGSRDPFALRRSALGVIRLIVENGLRFPLATVRPELVEGQSYFGREDESRASTGSARTDWWEELHDFFADRLKVQQREAGVRHDLIDAVFALGGEDDLVRLLARVKALQAFVETSEGTDLLAGYKRAANILKKEAWGNGVIPAEGGSQEQLGGPAGASISSSEVLGPGVRRDDEGGQNSLPYTPENEEAALIAALEAAEPRARAAVEAEDFEGAMAALASLRAPVDAFFDKVTVNDPDQDKRTARLNLLARMRAAVHQVADFSKIEG
ncbi:glycine--tRNA ligase subunit beta [Sphingosinicella humi]|uniref:Glycine--tRNA ligase beta subunit n=1 Tax=Allosphingosinicella humi TaxID=2068657 RepID=A0A2U2J4K2_9SPHN|nr:glycine--tRNA ligase subunit beta [Sphingosinicella humi]PWG03276.1 glycine--tRNA ligase subunit beta [Sphingosinicella humi]